MTNRFCIPMGARYARPSVSPWMNADSKSTDIPYRPSKAPSIARCTTLLMIAYGRASGRGMQRRGLSRCRGERTSVPLFLRNVEATGISPPPPYSPERHQERCFARSF